MKALQPAIRRSHRHPMRGFTMIEVAVTIVILAILAMIAVPSFSEVSMTTKLTSYANSFAASARLARSEAIKRNAPVTLCIAADANATTCSTSGGWEQGWIVLSGSTVLRRQAALVEGYQLTGNVTSITFETIGAGATSATLTLCRHSPSAGSQEREIKISLTGKTSVSTTYTGVCTPAS